jgi:hypothetical protein
MEEGVTFYLNYNIMLIIASVLGGLGLMSNLGVTIIASMLVLSIMGSVIRLVYGCSASVDDNGDDDCKRCILLMAPSTLLKGCPFGTTITSPFHSEQNPVGLAMNPNIQPQGKL